MHATTNPAARAALAIGCWESLHRNRDVRSGEVAIPWSVAIGNVAREFVEEAAGMVHGTWLGGGRERAAHRVGEEERPDLGAVLPAP